ncbi:MAG: sel1 repeat family protein [Candidatus Pacebacteria bacterium]|nr:sel1 repeat family protein [Candidatus Paceibacterota bacterium]
MIAVVCYFVFRNGKAGVSLITNNEIISTEQTTSYLLQANTAYENGDSELARQLYLKAAQNGNADAHFALAYKYVLPDDENTFHYIEAAKKGHEEALGYALDDLFFRAASLSKANPSLAIEIYQQAKKANPSLQIYDEDTKLKTIQMCVEPGSFDVEAFIKKYNIIIKENDFYGVWSLAEEASIGGIFGKPDPKLVFNLVCRGGFVPAELEYAVEDTYRNWKNGIEKKFNICDFVTSGIGAGFCASRQKDAG